MDVEVSLFPFRLGFMTLGFVLRVFSSKNSVLTADTLHGLNIRRFIVYVLLCVSSHSSAVVRMGEFRYLGILGVINGRQMLSTSSLYNAIERIIDERLGQVYFKVSEVDALLLCLNNATRFEDLYKLWTELLQFLKQFT
jgi:hypothetical protein